MFPEGCPEGCPQADVPFQPGFKLYWRHRRRQAPAGFDHAVRLALSIDNMAPAKARPAMER